MRIALLITGRITENEEQVKNYDENVIQNYDMDIFYCHPKTNNKELIERFKNKYKLKGLIENDENYYDVSNYNIYHWNVPSIHNYMCALLARKKC